jgi:hypothetical protein
LRADFVAQLLSMQILKFIADSCLIILILFIPVFHLILAFISPVPIWLKFSGAIFQFLWFTIEWARFEKGNADVGQEENGDREVSWKSSNNNSTITRASSRYTDVHDDRL